MFTDFYFVLHVNNCWLLHRLTFGPVSPVPVWVRCISTVFLPKCSVLWMLCSFWEAEHNNSWTQWRKLGSLWLANPPALGTEGWLLLAEGRRGILPEAGGGSLAGFTDRQTVCWGSHVDAWFYINRCTLDALRTASQGLGASAVVLAPRWEEESDLGWFRERQWRALRSPDISQSDSKQVKLMLVSLIAR